MAGVTTFNGRQGDISLQPSDIAGAGGALTISPALTGVPTAPTASPGTNNQQVATTAFVLAAVATGVSGVGSFNGRTGLVVLTTADVTGVGGALLASPIFTGIPQAPTQAQSDNSTNLATTAFVKTALANYILPAATSSVVGGVKQGANVTIAVDGTLSVAAPYVLPAATLTTLGGVSVGAGLTVTPQGQLAAIVTTPYVLPQATTSVLGGVVVGNGLTVTSGTISLNLPAATSSALGGVKQGANVTIAGDGTISVAPAYVLPAANASILGGIKVGTGLSVVADGTLSIATGGSSAVVNSFNTRTGAVTLQASDIVAAGGAPLASPSFSGNPISVTPAQGDSTGSIATTAFASNIAHGATTVTVSGSTTLTAAQLGTTVLSLSGTLTANTTLTLPANMFGLWAWDLTHITWGGFTLTLASASIGASATLALTSASTVIQTIICTPTGVYA